MAMVGTLGLFRPCSIRFKVSGRMPARRASSASRARHISLPVTGFIPRSLARSHHLTAYDAAYLELALRLGVPLAWLDENLKTAAREAGVAEFRP